jgi:hypothetical protein
MRDLRKSLYEHELLVLRVIGEWWDLDLTGTEKATSVETLAEALVQLDMRQEVAYLGPEEAAAFEDLLVAGGRMPVAAFARDHGDVRQMGPGRLEREEPWLDPVSAAEALWYRGFMYRGFDEAEGSDLVEYYYIPEELYRQLRDPEDASPPAAGGSRSSLEPAVEPGRFLAASIDAVDDLTTLLAEAQIMGLPSSGPDYLASYLLNRDPDRMSLLLALARELNLLRDTDEGARPARAVLGWLKRGREAQLRDLADAWSRSGWNDLCHTPGLECEGSNWQNDPILARTALIDVLPRDATWYQVSDLIARVRQDDPDFQRPDGRYDTWYIRDVENDAYLAGFENWALVEGRLLRFLIEGPMHWLGLADVARVRDGSELLFRLADRALAWLADRPAAAEEVTVPIVVHDDASVAVPFNAGRFQRFQVARVAEAAPAEPGRPFEYRLTPRSLERAREQGVDPDRLLPFLAEASGRPVPASTRRAIERWAAQGVEGRLEETVILRVRDKEILDKLRANPKTRDLIGEYLSDLAAAVRPDDWPELRSAAARLGLLLDHIN